MRRYVRSLIAAFLLISILLAACSPATVTPVTTQEPSSGGETTSPTDTPAPAATEAPAMTEELAGSMIDLPEVDPGTLTGDVVTAGSSTVFPLAEAIATRFENEGFSGNITIDSIGSGAGYERFCVAGETDVSNASRAIRDSEIESCQAIGREPIEFRVGTDAIAVTVSTENDFLTDVTLEQLAQIFSTAENWSDVDPSWPDEPILRYIPGTDSGTFDYFTEVVFEEDPEPMLNASNLNLSEDDNVLVQGVQGSPYSIGYFGYAYYNENQDTLKALSLDGIAPTEETAEDNSYPLSRPLFIYSDASIMQAKPQVAGYINFFLTNVNDEILTVGYFPASAAAIDAAKQNWLDAMGQ
ncbi:MAG: PstS family phosphate ABC transporter substrate-binding protein [Anaerolineales bacterium]